MINKKINEILEFTTPEGLREMTAEEHAKYFPIRNEESTGIRNEEAHTMIAMTYKKRHLLIGRAASKEAFLKATEKKIRKAVPTYENTGYDKIIVDGKELLTFRCRYTAQEAVQRADYALYVSSFYFLSFQCIYREENKDFAEQKFEEFLASVKFR